MGSISRQTHRWMPNDSLYWGSVPVWAIDRTVSVGVHRLVAPLWNTFKCNHSHNNNNNNNHENDNNNSTDIAFSGIQHSAFIGTISCSKWVSMISRTASPDVTGVWCPSIVPLPLLPLLPLLLLLLLTKLCQLYFSVSLIPFPCIPFLAMWLVAVQAQITLIASCVLSLAIEGNWCDHTCLIVEGMFSIRHNHSLCANQIEPRQVNRWGGHRREKCPVYGAQQDNSIIQH